MLVSGCGISAASGSVAHGQAGPRHVPTAEDPWHRAPGSGRARPYCWLVVSAVRRLLDELSYEGNASKYHDGGLGLENVITTEVFQALDFLPRQAFLGRVLAGPSGASLEPARKEVEQVV